MSKGVISLNCRYDKVYDDTRGAPKGRIPIKGVLMHWAKKGRPLYQNLSLSLANQKRVTITEN